MGAIRAAAGLPYVEIDLRVAADNEIILFHDRRLSIENARIDDTLVGKPISSLTREELNALRFPDGSRIQRL